MSEHEESIDKERIRQQIRQKLSLLPDEPGCYLMKNGAGQIIYVGKAKVLKNRVRSYFTGSHDAKTQRLVEDIVDFEYVVTASNVEALLLECNLIKKHHPHYNVLLKDDKTYPYLKITAELHPRLEVTRKVIKDHGKYFGPYPNAFAAQQTKKMLDRLYPLRKCKTLPDRACIYYHMEQCLAPCIQEVSAEENKRMVAEITRFLNGGQAQVRSELQEKMLAASEALEFERAREMRDLIMNLDALAEKQTVTTTDQKDRDIFGYAYEKGWMCVQILHMRQGKMLERHAALFAHYGAPEEDFISYVMQVYSDSPVIPKEIVLPYEKDGEEWRKQLEQLLGVKVSTPQRSIRREWVKMAENNAVIALRERFHTLERDENRTIKAAENLGDWLGIGNVSRIEAFDNSNIQGAHPVSAMVVFSNGKPDKSQYRKYNIRTVVGADDYETMREVIRRRYERVLKEGLTLPDLIIVDGGKGQISAAVDILENELGLFIPVGGLVKDERHRTAELMVGNPPEIVPLPRGSQEFYLLQRIQEEVHRFAISFHRQTRSKSMVASKLDEIPGIGEKRRKALLRHFGSLKRIKEATVEELRPLGISEKLAEQLLSHLREES